MAPLAETDLNRFHEQWQREGWTVNSVSAPVPQADGTGKRKAELSRQYELSGSDIAYDDTLIARIERGKTSEPQLIQMLGPAYTRDLQSDGRMQLAWRFAEATGLLNVELNPEGKVESYSARRGPR